MDIKEAMAKIAELENENQKIAELETDNQNIMADMIQLKDLNKELEDKMKNEKKEYEGIKECLYMNINARKIDQSCILDLQEENKKFRDKIDEINKKANKEIRKLYQKASDEKIKKIYDDNEALLKEQDKLIKENEKNAKLNDKFKKIISKMNAKIEKLKKEELELMNQTPTQEDFEEQQKENEELDMENEKLKEKIKNMMSWEDLQEMIDDAGLDESLTDFEDAEFSNFDVFIHNIKLKWDEFEQIEVENKSYFDEKIKEKDEKIKKMYKWENITDMAENKDIWSDEVYEAFEDLDIWSDIWDGDPEGDNLKIFMKNLSRIIKKMEEKDEDYKISWDEFKKKINDSDLKEFEWCDNFEADGEDCFNEFISMVEFTIKEINHQNEFLQAIKGE